MTFGRSGVPSTGDDPLPVPWPITIVRLVDQLPMCSILFCNENCIVAGGYGGKPILISRGDIAVNEDRRWTVKDSVEWEVTNCRGDAINSTGGGGDGRIESGSSDPAKDSYSLPTIWCMKQSSLRLGRGSGDADGQEFSIRASASGADGSFHFFRLKTGSTEQVVWG